MVDPDFSPQTISVSITDACKLIGAGRSIVYELIGKQHIHAVKLGRRTLIPVASLQAYIAGLPTAKIKAVSSGKNRRVPHDQKEKPRRCGSARGF
jgi:excisionase family DNA binding protein